jgi:hypothetical protein
MISAKSFNIIKLSRKPLVYVKDSTRPNGGKGLFAKEDIPANHPVVIYYGKRTNSDEIFQAYEDNPENYLKNIFPYVRDTERNEAINGATALGHKNNNVLGVYVNDYDKLKNSTKKEMKRYAKTAQKCNLEIADTLDFPIYFSRRKIKKDEELFAHYSIGYWLLHLGTKVEDMEEIYKKHDWNQFYE